MGVTSGARRNQNGRRELRGRAEYCCGGGTGIGAGALLAPGIMAADTGCNNNSEYSDGLHGKYRDDGGDQASLGGSRSYHNIRPLILNILQADRC